MERRGKRTPARRPGISGGDGAYGEALRALARRPLTEFEVQARLVARGYTTEIARETLTRLRRAGYVDDRALALDYLVTRTERKGHAPERLLRELERRGVAVSVARDAWREVEDEHGVDARLLLRRELDRRVGPHTRSLAPRDLRRIYNALVRAGFDAGEVRSALEPHFRRVAGVDIDDESHA